jgi:lipoprotein-releasing system ATP-binding protein
MSNAVQILEVQNLARVYKQGDESLQIFKDLSFSIARGEIVALVGSSGAGKSTLLQLVGLLDQPSAGQIIIDGQSVGQLSDEQRTKIRGQKLGFVYQFHYLQAEFSAMENVMIPQMIGGLDPLKAQEKAKKLLADVGLSHRLDHRPARLSGGEQQRVAIARALANDPALILADEPTGNLDPSTSDDVFSLFVERVRTQSMSAFIATHNMDLAKKMDRILFLKNGQLSEG